MEDSIFTKIINGEIPSHRVYEDDYSFAFLDIHPIQPGHVLVVPKKQIESWLELDDETYTHLMLAVKEVGSRLKEVLKTPYVGLRVVGVDVLHVHVHLIPFSTVEEFNKKQDLNSEPNHDKLGEMATRLAF